MHHSSQGVQYRDLEFWLCWTLKVFKFVLRIFDTFLRSLSAVHEEVAPLLDVSTDTKYICLDVGAFREHVITPDQILFQFSPFIYSFIYVCIYLLNLPLRREIAFIVIT